MQYKTWSTEEEWLPTSAQEPLEIFKVSAGSPEAVVPNWELKNCLADVKLTVSKLEVFFTAEEVHWWREFLDNPGPTDNSTVWYLDQIDKHMPGHACSGWTCRNSSD